MFFTRLLTRLNDVCNRLGSNGNIAQIQSRNADAAVANAVDGMLFTKHIHFFRRKTREGEHALLLDGKAHIHAFGLAGLKERRAHRMNAGAHAVNFLAPGRFERRVGENFGNNLAAVARRVGIFLTNDALED